MPHVIAEPCIGTKDTSCVSVCPVDCIHPTKNEADFGTVNQLYIDPDTCIDCGACVPECPFEAIFPEEDVPTEQLAFIKLNAELSRKWPSITRSKAPLPDADDWKDRSGKLSELQR